MSDNLLNTFVLLAYLLAAALFILGIKNLGSPVTAPRGNRLAAVGMFIAIVVTLMDKRVVSYELILAGIVVGIFTFKTCMLSSVYFSFAVSFDLNMPNMRSVTKKPPTTLIVASTIATKPSIDTMLPSRGPATIKAPTTVIPDIALAPDMRGVCNVGGTLVISSRPTNIARTKMDIPVIRLSDIFL